MRPAPYSRALVPLAVSLLLSGCADTVRLPLCPKIAERSFDEVQRGAVVNRYILQAVKARDIEIVELSKFAASFRGSGTALDWLQDNYVQLLCAFDPDHEENVRATYISCTQHARRWVEIIQSDAQEDLMIVQTLFRTNCVPHKF